MVVDWSSSSYGMYHHVRKKVRCVGESVNDLLQHMGKSGVQAEKIHLIGHSLGAHVAGVAGRLSAAKLSRITGKEY